MKRKVLMVIVLILAVVLVAEIIFLIHKGTSALPRETTGEPTGTTEQTTEQTETTVTDETENTETENTETGAAQETTEHEEELPPMTIPQGDGESAAFR